MDISLIGILLWVLGMIVISNLLKKEKATESVSRDVLIVQGKVVTSSRGTSEDYVLWFGLDDDRKNLWLSHFMGKNVRINVEIMEAEG